jgi:hypothetical protein
MDSPRGPERRSWSRTDVWLGLPVVACMLAADLERATDLRLATELSMAGWALLLVQVAWWTRDGDEWGAAAAWLGRVAVAAVPAFVTLYAFYVHSRTLEAGVHVDAVYTYVGLQWFFELHNPITFAGSTYSYHQLPLLLLTHLPALPLGIDALGAFAIHAGAMVQVALLLAVAAVRLVPGSLPRQALAAALAAAVFSNRLMILTYNTIGYPLPLVMLGLMLAIVAADDSPAGVDRPVGGLLAAALLHHYPGWTMVLPLVVAWLVLRRHPVAATRAFLHANPVLLTVLAMALTTNAVHPDLLLTRVRDVSLYDGLPAAGAVDTVRGHWSYLTSVFPRVRYAEFVKGYQGSWLLLNAPPLGPWGLPVMAATWVASALVVPRRALRYATLLVLLLAGLVGLTALQHLVTDFMDYRDFPLVHGATAAGLLFALRAPGRAGWRSAGAVALALAIGAHNWTDLATLAGKRFGTSDYAPRAQEALEAVRRLTRAGRLAPLDVTRVVVVGEEFVALQGPYEAFFARHGVALRIVPLPEYCGAPLVTTKSVEGESCDAFLLVVPFHACRNDRPVDSLDPTAGATATLYPSVCTGDPRQDRPSEPFPLDG